MVQMSNWPDRESAAKYPGTLRALFESEAAASMMTGSFKPCRARLALRRAATFLGHEARPEEITEDLLTAFNAFMLGLGKSKGTASEAVTLVRTITKLGRPDFRQQARGRGRLPNPMAMNKMPPPKRSPEEITSLARPETLLADAYWHVYFPRVLCMYAKQTMKLYRLSITLFSVYLGRMATLGDLTDENVTGWLGWCKQQEITPQTVNCRRAKLLALWRFLARKRYVPDYPDVPVIDEPAPVPQAWTQAQLTKLLDACRAFDGRDFDGVNGSAWFLALHLVAYDTGARAGELFSLRWDWLDVDTGDLAVPAGARKGRKKPMLYRLHPETLVAVMAIAKPTRELVFPLGCDMGTFYNRYKRVLTAAGLPADRRSKLHRLRRTFASYLEAASPGAATDALAHSSRAVTRAYLDERISKRVRPIDLLPRPGQQAVGPQILSPGGNSR